MGQPPALKLSTVAMGGGRKRWGSHLGEAAFAQNDARNRRTSFRSRPVGTIDLPDKGFSIQKALSLRRSEPARTPRFRRRSSSHDRRLTTDATLAGKCAFRNLRTRLMVRAFSSGGSFQGYTVTSAFGASEATSTDAWYACAGVSSGRTRKGVWQ